MSQGVKHLLTGSECDDVGELWNRIYVNTAMDGRRGALIHALGAVEIALWDIRGKALGKPVWALLNREARDYVVGQITVAEEMEGIACCVG